MSDGNRQENGNGKSLLKRFSDPSMLRTLVLSAISLITFLVLWQVLAMYLNEAYLPTPKIVWQALVLSFQQTDPILGTTMGQNIVASLRRFLVGFAIALMVAIPVGLLMGFSKTFNDLIKPIVEIFRPIPPIAWVPILFVIFSYIWGPVLAISIGAFFPIVTSVSFGVKSVEPIYYDAARTQGATRLDIFNKVVIPFTLPYMMTGIRIGLGVAWMCIIAAEMIMAVGGGIGYYIWYYGFNGPYANFFAGVIVLAVLGIITVGLAEYTENYILKSRGMK
jgi:ABC-type nitrate/sulfonate/bicarbonate transport system permease component